MNELEQLSMQIGQITALARAVDDAINTATVETGATENNNQMVYLYSLLLELLEQHKTDVEKLEVTFTQICYKLDICNLDEVLSLLTEKRD